MRQRHSSYDMYDNLFVQKGGVTTAQSHRAHSNELVVVRQFLKFLTARFTSHLHILDTQLKHIKTLGYNSGHTKSYKL